jgi:hypothetical protein
MVDLEALDFTPKELVRMAEFNLEMAVDGG